MILNKLTNYLSIYLSIYLETLTTLPWVPETFHARFPVSVKSYKWPARKAFKDMSACGRHPAKAPRRAREKPLVPRVLIHTLRAGRHTHATNSQEYPPERKVNDFIVNQAYRDGGLYHRIMFLCSRQTDVFIDLLQVDLTTWHWFISG